MATTKNNKVASITTNFEMDENGQINYDIKINGNINKVIELGHKVFLECKTRIVEHRQMIDEKLFPNFNTDNK